jgi:hypothetical protein
MSCAISRAGASGRAVTTVVVMISCSCTARILEPAGACVKWLIGPRIKIAPVEKLTPSQQRKRERVEALIGLMAPALTVVLAAGDRISRIVQPEDHDYYPVRPVGDREGAPPR